MRCSINKYNNKPCEKNDRDADLLIFKTTSLTLTNLMKVYVCCINDHMHPYCFHILNGHGIPHI